MPTKKDGVMIILSSPSGAGKTTLVGLLSQRPDFEISISHTTRKPRQNEKQNKDYFFVSETEFKRLIGNEEFLEYARVFNNLYGTTRTPVIESLNNGKHVLFDIDWQGTDQIKKNDLKFKLITFFILPPSKKTLLNRLAERENNKDEIINERMKKFEEDVKHWKDYDYVVINDNLEICVHEIKEIIDSELKKQKKFFDKSKINEHVKSLIN